MSLDVDRARRALSNPRQDINDSEDNLQIDDTSAHVQYHRQFRESSNPRAMSPSPAATSMSDSALEQSAEMSLEDFREFQRTGIKKQSKRRPGKQVRQEDVSIDKIENFKVMTMKQNLHHGPGGVQRLQPSSTGGHGSHMGGTADAPSGEHNGLLGRGGRHLALEKPETPQLSHMIDQMNIDQNSEPGSLGYQPQPQIVSQRKEIEYRSRGDLVYIDTESMDRGSNSSGGQSSKGNYNSINYLKAQEHYLETQIEKNKQLIEVEKQKAALGVNADAEIKPNQRFKNFNEVFSGLTKSKNVVTTFPIISCIITYNSKSVVAVTKRNDREYNIKQYSLESYALTFEEKIGGKEDSYIKCKDVEQNASGQKFAVVYLDDGKFRLRTFGETSRTQEEIDANEFGINEALGISDYTMPINNFPDPFITCAFVHDDLIFVNLFENYSLTHNHFFFVPSTRQTSRYTQVLLDSNNKNFPYKCFYSAESNEVFSFYRQCQSFRVPVFEIDRPQNHGKQDFIYEKIYDKDLGQMFLINGVALICRCSSQILFFKLQVDEFTKQTHWSNYQSIDTRGFLYYIKGNKRIQITTDTQIFFYLIDPKTFEATLENVMFNFMNCSQMMFGSKVRYCVTFKTNQRSFDIYRRKFEHDFRPNVVSENLDGSRGIQIESINAFVVSKIDEIHFYDVDNYNEIKEAMIKIPLLKSVSREPNEIISMAVSPQEDMLAVISGKNLIMNEQYPNQLFIFQKVSNKNLDEIDNFNLVKRIIIKERPEFEKICMKFIFKTERNGEQPTSIIFAKQREVMELNFVTEEIKVVFRYDQPLSKQPEFFLMNEDQTVYIIGSMEDCIYYNQHTAEQIDLDQLYDISNIKEMYYDEEERVFYMLANKFQEKLGIFLITFDDLDPSKHQFILRWKNKLDVSDANVFIVRNKKKKYKELVVSFKTIFINVYNVCVMDISNIKNVRTLFRHESFQLWESQISGFYLSKNKDFVTINREGINVLTLSANEKRPIIGDSGQEKMLHSLGSSNYLKPETQNFILFEFATDKRVISIMQQYQTDNNRTGEETQFKTIYKIRIHSITLRELLLFQSLYVCKTQSDILRLVSSQPHAEVFFKSFFELDCTNMVSILSFDSRSMRHLLSDKNQQFFQAEFPIFYKNKIQKSNNQSKYFYRSAIDNALRNNQIRAVGYIIEYICKYQNNYVSSYLFQRIMSILMQKGVDVTGLLNSKIFCFSFDFDEWPSTHCDQDFLMKPYNGSLFDLRSNYEQIFDEDKYKVQEFEEYADSSKVFKINYCINMLPNLEMYAVRDKVTGELTYVNEGVSLMNLAVESGELDIFDSENFQQLIKFKWTKFAKALHFKGCIAHFGYLLLMIFYVDQIYIKNNEEFKQTMSFLLVFAVIYPCWYDSLQLYKIGWRAYFSDIQNYSDLVYTYGSLTNVLLQNTGDPQNFSNKLIMCVLMLQQLIKSFFFLRIFDPLSYIVTMINRVISDLRVFLLFYSILTIVFSMIFAIIGVGNANIPGSFQEYNDDVKASNEYLLQDGYHLGFWNIPNEEYEKIGLFFGYIFMTLRYSLGDFDFDASTELDTKENYLYWIIWFLTVVMTCVVFLNFIIAEASNSYQEVKDRLTAIVNMEKASLIEEAEYMTFSKYKDEKLFPKYVIIREIET